MRCQVEAAQFKHENKLRTIDKDSRRVPSNAPFFLTNGDSGAMSSHSSKLRDPIYLCSYRDSIYLSLKNASYVLANIVHIWYIIDRHPTYVPLSNSTLLAQTRHAQRDACFHSFQILRTRPLTHQSVSTTQIRRAARKKNSADG